MSTEVVYAAPLDQEMLHATPCAFLDDAAREERRARAVSGRRWLEPETASDLGALDLAAIERVREEVWPQVDRADELHDALVELGFITPSEGRGWEHFLDELSADRRAAVFHASPAGPSL